MPRDVKHNHIKLIVVSDIHHATDLLESLLPVINTSDRLIFCGDGYSAIKQVRGRITVPIVCVRGNNDFFADIVEQTVEDLGGVKALVTHGHKLGVRYSTETLVEEAIRNECALAFYGHTHIFYDRTISGIHVVNPGALCDRSYALVEGNADGFIVKHLHV